MGDNDFARLIKKRRNALGLTQARLGDLVGRSASTIRNWERGASTPAERSDAVALAAVLGLEESDLLTRAGFEVAEQEKSPTMEQAYASLARVRAESATAPERGRETQPTVESVPPEDEPSDEEPHLVEDSVELHRAAPPTVLEAAQSGEPSYLEDPEERQRYRARAVTTAVIVVALVFVLFWAFGRATDSLGNLWDDFVNSLEL